MVSQDNAQFLPPVPARLRDRPVAVWEEPLTIDTYSPGEPSRHPHYLDRRVYQGSSGRVYPLPFIDSVESTKRPQAWRAVHLENAYVRLVVLPELGGRIYCAVDKTRDYPFFYLNHVIKPALVGLAGPWISGGVEFNWPQHHRPATYLPTASRIEEREDGSATVWCWDHDPFNRLLGIHGIGLSPDSAVIDCRVRLTNRTEDVATFLWWANVAAPVGDSYQSFFPPDVTQVADHARRAVTTFPQVEGLYYGVDYRARVTAERPDADRLDWYRNIPVPTSYMCVDSKGDFFGGYDHAVGAGFVHWADHRIAPGKKQWTWGNAPFGWAWDRNLTDADGPYVELMAGVFTDNQPDFSFLAPGETKRFSQHWYPFQDIGPVRAATLEAAVAVTDARLGVAVTRPRPRIDVVVTGPSGETCWSRVADAVPGRPFTAELAPVATADITGVTVKAGDETLIEWRAERPVRRPVASATEPPSPDQIATNEELYLTGLHLAQYRHATRSPGPYWRAAVDRDPGDARSNTALSATAWRAGDLEAAESFARAAIGRLTKRNPNPYDSEAHYRLGLAAQAQGRSAEARDALTKAAWSGPWKAAAVTALTRLESREGRIEAARALAEQLPALSPGDPQARALMALTGASGGADEPWGDGPAAFDWWLADIRSPLGPGDLQDAQVAFDVALEYASVGRRQDTLRLARLAARIEADAPVAGAPRVTPLAHYLAAEALDGLGDGVGAAGEREAAQTASDTWCFPGRLEEHLILDRQRRRDPGDGRASKLAGFWLYAHDRAAEAMAAWRDAAAAGGPDAVVLRCLGVGAFNVEHDPAEAWRCYEAALAIAPEDPELWRESDQLAERMGMSAADRLARLDGHEAEVAARDDLSAAYAGLLTATGRAAEAAELLTGRDFHPWEGGEGVVLAAWEGAQLALAAAAQAAGRPAEALIHVEAALTAPRSLGEDRHTLANAADLRLARGDALAALGRTDEAEAAWDEAAAQRGDFLEMATAEHSEKTYHSALALGRLGRVAEARALLEALRAFADDLAAAPARIDYFATSLPAMLLFHDDPVMTQTRRAQELRAIAAAGLAELNQEEGPLKEGPTR